MVRSLLASAELSSPIPDNSRKLSSRVEVKESFVNTEDHRVFIQECSPPSGHFSKGVVLLLHGQSFTSSTWTEHNTMAVLAAVGYRCIAPDLPGGGRTVGPSIPPLLRSQFILQLRQALQLKELMIVCASMSSQYVLPLLGASWMQCLLAVAPSNTHNLGDEMNARTPVLVVYGEKDTSLGPTSAANLSVLPNCRSVRMEGAGHAAHLGNPILFQSIAFNFFELVRAYTSYS